MSLVLSTSAFSQNTTSKEYNFFDEKKASTAAGDEASKAPSAPGDLATPIDDYIPALAVVGLGMAIYFSRKKYSVVK